MLTNEQLATLKVDILADATLTYEGSITYHDVNAALALA